MRVSTSKSETMDPCQKTVDCPLYWGVSSYPKQRSFLGYLRVLIVTDRKMEVKLECCRH